MNLPSEFTTFANGFFSSEYNDFLQALQQESPTSIRLNSAKVQQSLNEKSVPWANKAYYLRQRPSFTLDPLFHAGCFYAQEASSMFLEQVFKQYVNQPVKVLDLCAAPGGKSTHILSLLPEGSLLVSNEVIRSRAGILAENITKWGYPNAIVTNNDASDFKQLKHFFDIILIDAPCSGEGMFRKDPEAIRQWSPGNVTLCSERQQRIIADIWTSLKPNGLLIYSTCTYNTKENEENVEWITTTFDAETLPVETKKDWNIATPIHPHVYRFFPHKIMGEGFSIAVIKKDEDEERVKITSSKNEKNKPAINSEIKQWLTNSEDFHFLENNRQITAIPHSILYDYQILKSKLKIVHAGISLAEIKGKDFIPTQALAFSNYLNKNTFNNVEIDYPTALKYLRKEAIVLSENTPKGYALLNYKNIPLGFVKNIGNRANNLYPQEWRIRMQNLPEGFEIVSDDVNL